MMARLLLLSFALSLSTASALADDVPFASPPPPPPGRQVVTLAALPDIMGKIQLRHMKIGEAIKRKNWKLLEYELGQTRDTFANAVILYQNIPIEFIAAADKPLGALMEAAKSKDGASLNRAYEVLTAACNNCHHAAQVGFIAIKTTTSSPFSDQEFQPETK